MIVRAAAIALVGLALVGTAGGAPGADPGLTPSTVLLGGTVPLTGEAAAFGSVGPGAKAYFDYVNAKGGVNGRKIEYRYYDDTYNPAQTVQLTRRLVEQDNVFAIFNLTGTEQNLAVRPFLNALKVPQLFGGTGVRSIGREHAKYPWSMGYLPSFFAEGRIYGRHLVSTRKNAKVAVLYEASDYGKDLFAGLKAGIGKKARIVGQTTYEVTDTDLSSQIAQLRRSGANVLMLFALPKQTIAGFVAANRLGWRPPTYVTSVSVDPAVMKIVQTTTGNKAGEGALTVQWMKDSSNPANAKDPAVRLYKTIMRRYAPGRNVDEVVHLYGMAVAYSMVQTLKAAGRNPTRASLLRAATHMNHQVPFMVKGIEVKTSPSDYFPISDVRFLKYQRGYWRQVGRVIPAPD